MRLNNTISAQYIALFIILWTITSCKRDSVETAEEYLSITITNSSGDDFYYSSNDEVRYFAPYPFNVGYLGLEEQEVMLISKRLDKGDEVAIIPIAKMSIMESDLSARDVLIAIPHAEKYRIIESSDFTDFTVGQFSLKQIVEYWYSNRYGLQGTTIQGWSAVTPLDIK